MVVVPLSPQSRLIYKHLQTTYTNLYTKRPDLIHFRAFLCALLTFFIPFSILLDENVHKNPKVLDFRGFNRPKAGSAEFSAHRKGRGATPRPTIIVRGVTPRFATMTVQRYAFYFRNPRIRVMKLRMTRTNGCLFKYRSKTAATMTATMNAM